MFLGILESACLFVGAFVTNIKMFERRSLTMENVHFCSLLWRFMVLDQQAWLIGLSVVEYVQKVAFMVIKGLERVAKLNFTHS